MDNNFLKSVGGRGTPHRPIFLTCMEHTLKSWAILMKFTQNVYIDEEIFQIKNFHNWTGGKGTPHRPIFLTCMESALKSGAILMKFTQNVYMEEKISWTKKISYRTGAGYPS